MKLAIYYHIVFALDSKGNIYTPAYYGKFIETLSENVSELMIIAHTINGKEDYKIKSTNILLHDLGPITSSLHRHFFHKKILYNIKGKLLDFDAIIIRSPSPLAPFFSKYIPPNCLIIFYNVGSYNAVLNELRIRSLRDIFVKYYLKLNHYLFINQLKNRDVLVNNLLLFDEYSAIAKKVHYVPTSSFTRDDFYERLDTCSGDIINILYTGRLDLQKGLVELLHSMSELKESFDNIHLHIVGKEYEKKKTVEKLLKVLSFDLNINNIITFHGYKTNGPELNKMYRMSDIYVIPSYNEGFPRTIWEAMANSLPVVTTDVGGIPMILSHNKNAFFIKPKSIEALTKAISKLIYCKELRMNIIRNGTILCTDYTCETLSFKLVDKISELINSNK